MAGAAVSGGVWSAILTENGPWALLVFFLLWRDFQKEAAIREALNKNSTILVELTTLIKERLPRGG